MGIIAGCRLRRSFVSYPESLGVVLTGLRTQVFRFLQVGLVGFTIDISVISLLLYGVGLDATDEGKIVSRVASFIAAISVAFVLNARYTFGATIRESSFSLYVAIQCLGAAINLGTYSALVLVGPFNELPLAALVVGSACATVSNFLLVRRFVYNRGLAPTQTSQAGG